MTSGPRIRDTAKSKNLEVEVPDAVSVEEMESRLVEVATALGLALSHTTKLGEKRYPGNRHWHLKQHPKEAGCLDVTYWPSGPLMWVTMRNYEPDWVHDRGRQLVRALGEHLRSSAP